MKYKKFRIIIASLIIAFLCLGFCGTFSYAEDADSDQTFDVLDNPTDYISDDEKQQVVEGGTGLPASFDLRNVDTDGDGIGDRCYVTPVRSQYPFATCWGFASMSAAETSILSRVLKNEPNAWKTLNLSEKQLIFFANVFLNDPDSSQNGEGRYGVKEEDPRELPPDDIYGGGSAFLAAHTFAAGIGPVLESRDEALEYKGKNGIIQEGYETDGIVFPASYSKEDDWLLEEKYRYLQDYVLADSYYLPSPALITKATNYQYEYNEAGTIAIKENLLSLNAVAIGFCSDISRPWQTEAEGTYMNARTWAHYTWKSESSNHAVTIVGWDDNYSKENFSADHQPPANGAWLVKNSWGSGQNEFPDMGSGNWGIPVPKTDEYGNEVLDEDGNPVMVGSGYFWLSYYDQSISMPEVFIFDPWLKGAGTKYDPETLHRDQYDLMPVTSILEVTSQTPVKTANVFEPEKTEHVLNVAYELATPGTTVQYEIYLLKPDASSPEDGILMAHGEQTYPYGGYYQEYLDEPVIIQKGQRYSIVVAELLPDGSYGINAPQAYGPNKIIACSKAVVNEGESLISLNGTWTDWLTEGTRATVFADRWEYMENSIELDNFPIKGIAYDAPIDIGVRSVDPNEGEIEVSEGDSATLNLEVFGTEQTLWDPEYNSVEWKVMDKGGQYVSVTPSSDGLSATVNGLKPGKAYVYAVMNDVGTVIFTVNVIEAESETETEPDVNIYYYVGKEKIEYMKDSDSTLSFKFKRSENDEETFGHFTGAKVDGNQLTLDEDYKAYPGSVIIELQTPFLQTLSVGEHTLTAMFDDGEEVNVTFVVEQSGAKIETGDTNNMLIWIVLLIASAGAISGLLLRRKV